MLKFIVWTCVTDRHIGKCDLCEKRKTLVPESFRFYKVVLLQDIYFQKIYSANDQPVRSQTWLVGQIQNPRIDGKDPIGTSQLFCLKYTGLQFKTIDNSPRNVHKIQLYLYSSFKPGTTLHTSKLSHMITYCKVVNYNMSCLKAHAGFFILLRKEIFDPYVLWPFDKNWLVTQIRIHNYTVFAIIFSKSFKTTL